MLLDILEILFPVECVNCGFLGRPVCKDCFGQFQFEPHVREIGGLKVCASMYYEENSILEKLILPFKYNHQKEIFRFFVTNMINTMNLLYYPERLILVPVPLHKKRELERGYNQSEVLAKNIARKSGVKMFKVLERVKNTSQQAKSASKVERQKNMAGAFKVVGKFPKDSHLVLVDDIVTSGSTLMACRLALLEAGYLKVSALTLADRENFGH